MALNVETFDNVRGGNALYKALTHPRAAQRGRALVAALSRGGPIAVYDPHGAAAPFAEIFAMRDLDVEGIYVQDVTRIDSLVLGRRARAAIGLARSPAARILVAAFDADRLIQQLRPCLRDGAEVVSLDAMRLPEERLTDRKNYLNPLNFATNYALFRDTGRLHTRLVMVNYWAGYGADAVTCWMTLFDETGEIIAEWCEGCGPAGCTIIVDSREIRARFRLRAFAGQLLIHVVGAAGHDIVKYAIDTIGEEDGVEGRDSALSCTHDANAWPADRYAGLPAPAPDEQVLLWLQNAHPVPIPAGAMTVNRMGEESETPIEAEIAPFATQIVDIGELLPNASWPQQIELRAGKHVVRPRYEIVERGRRRIAHMNVERTDLSPDPQLPRLGELLGKGYILPAPILPRDEWLSTLLPTPMAVSQIELPIAALVYDPDGREIARHSLGALPRGHTTALELAALSEPLGDGYGHVELVYDFASGGEADGWLHALFRYRHLSGHAAETSFGAHMFNTVLVYRGEPQSYHGRPPGLSTRLFLRLGEAGHDTLCHLIYPASQPWLATSATEIMLHDSTGSAVARAAMAIPCSGSRLWRYHTMFDAPTRARAGIGAYITIRDKTCRLFGYHGLLGRGGGFSLDHMFGF